MKRTWRVAAIVGVAIAVSLVVVSLVELAPRAVPSNNCATGIRTLQAPPLVFEGSGDTTKGSDHWYNFTVLVSDDCYSLGIISFTLTFPDGSAVPLPGGAGVTVVTPLSLVQAEFTIGIGWAYEPGFSATTPLQSQDTLSLFYSGSTPSTLVGDSFSVLSSRGSCSGPIS